MKVKNIIFRIFTVLALFAFFSCTNLIEELKKFVVDTQEISAEDLELDSVSSVSAGDNLIVEATLDNGKVVLKSVGYGETSVAVKGKVAEEDVTVVLTVEVSKEGSIVSWVSERIVEGKKIVTENIVKTDSEGTKDLQTVETVTDTATGTVEKTTETVSKTKTDGSSEVVTQIKEGDATTVVTTIFDKDGNGKETVESVDSEGNKTLVSEKDVTSDDTFTETTVEKTPEELNLPAIATDSEVTVDTPDVAEVEIVGGKLKVKSKKAGTTKVTVTGADNKPVVLIIVVKVDGTFTITPENEGGEGGSEGDDPFIEDVVEPSMEDLNLANVTEATVEDDSIVVVTVEDGKIKLTSKKQGSTKVTVKCTGKKPATFTVTVEEDGSIAISDMVPAVDNADVSIDVQYGQGEYEVPFTERNIETSLEDLNLSSPVSVAVENSTVLTAVADEVKVNVTSKTPGTTKVTVSGSTNRTATFTVTVKEDGAITISEVVPAKDESTVTVDVNYGHNEYFVPQ